MLAALTRPAQSRDPLLALSCGIDSARLARDTWEKIAPTTSRSSRSPEPRDRDELLPHHSASLLALSRNRSPLTPGAESDGREELPIFEEIPKHFEKARMPVTQCFMCHQGRVTPERGGGRD